MVSDTPAVAMLRSFRKSNATNAQVSPKTLQNRLRISLTTEDTLFICNHSFYLTIIAQSVFYICSFYEAAVFYQQGFIDLQFGHLADLQLHEDSQSMF